MAHAMILVGIPENPVPGDANAGYFTARDGFTIRYAWWAAAASERKGTVCIFPGRGEFIEKYFETVADLRARGFAVAVLDWRGQGGSRRQLANARKGHVDLFEQYDGDLAEFMEKVVLPDCLPPYFALAHSMGANIMLRAARQKTWFDRMVLLAPLVKLGPHLLPDGVISALSELLTFAGFGGSFVPGGTATAGECVPYKNNRLTSDLARLARGCAIIQHAPHLALGSPTIQWLYAACQAMAVIAQPDFPQSVQVPMLLIGAGRDRVISTPAIERLASEIRVGTYIEIVGARHEILQERDQLRDQFWAAFDAFIPGTPAYAAA